MANITGTANPDILTGTALSDLIEGLASDDVLYGFDGNDSLLGDVGDDILYGGSGDDTLDGGAGEDLFYGQSGLDTVTYASALAALTLNMADNSLSTGDAAGDFYLSIEAFLLTGLDDTFVGNEFGNQVSGGDGNDLLQGFGGNDRLFGDAGNDTLDGGQGADVLIGGAGVDRASYASSTAAITLDFLEAANTTGDARLDSFISIEAVQLTRFDDTAVLSPLLRRAFGGDGNDTILGGTGHDTVLGGNGNDSLTGDAGNDILQGEGGFDLLDGGAGDDTQIGGSGNDVLFSSEGADVLDGGDGLDVVLYFGNLILDMSSPSNSTGQAQGDILTGIERVVFAGPGTAVYIGGSGDMTVSAGGAIVTAFAGSGAEAFVVGPGSMTVSYAQTSDTGVSFSAVSNVITGTRGALGDRLFSVGSLTLTSRNDVYDLTGFTGSRPIVTTLNAGGGNDRLTLAQTVTSVVDTGNGNDTVAGRMVDGSLSLGGGKDRVDMAVLGIGVPIKPLVVSGGAGADTITIATTRALLTVTGDAGDDTIELSDTLQFGSYTVDGGDGDDTITTLSGEALVSGGLGADVLTVTALTFLQGVSGGDGDDTIVANALAGLAEGGEGADTVTFHLLLSGAGTAILDGGAGNDTLTLLGDFAFGTTGPGNRAVFRGGAGNDTLIDSSLAEFVATTFAFGPLWGADTVIGFDDGVDVINFEDTAGVGLDEFADLTVTGDASQTLVSFGINTILLQGLNFASFSEADVLFT